MASVQATPLDSESHKPVHRMVGGGQAVIVPLTQPFLARWPLDTMLADTSLVFGSPKVALVYWPSLQDQTLADADGKEQQQGE